MSYTYSSMTIVTESRIHPLYGTYKRDLNITFIYLFIYIIFKKSATVAPS